MLRWTSLGSAALLRSIHGLAFAMICLIGIVASPVDVLCQSCGEQGDSTPNPDAFFTAPSTATCTSNGSVVSDHDMPGGAYYPINTDFRIDTSETITGICNYCVGSQYFFSQTRYLLGVTRDTYDPTLSSTHALTSAAYQVQRLDTHDGSGYEGSGYHTQSLNQSGTWRFDFQASAYATNCTPAVDSGVVSKSINGLKCGPEFNRDSFGNIAHEAATTIQVYVPSTMSGLWDSTTDSGPLKGAVTDWNSVLSGTGVTLQLTSTLCSGANCIVLAQSSLAGQCAQTAMPTNSGSGGLATGTTSVTFTTGDGTIPSWTGADPTALQRTAAHELGHALGMTHPVHGTNCSSVNDAVMLDMVTTCNGSTTGYHPTLDDTLPVQKTVYGGGTDKKCGFPTP
jgi:hypothetical protein